MLAIEYKIHLAVGAPLKSEKLPKIGLISIDRNGLVQTYSKMHLHGGEENYFSPGNKHHLITLNNTKIANAICADTNHPIHCLKCVNLGASAYIAGSMISSTGYQADTDMLQNYAEQYNMLVALANYSSKTGKVADGWQPIGKSAIWLKQGLLVVAE
ncbi:nitrilase-related carbon-nitrogen hydrolase [Psychromonas sp. KJ10-10]|uniref:nitrilase-related carbon-nitrogen hydrolase n=1 Tax=Psychromonas sp. KJ10-10 TaxID=3391823 RepID=UPI0039B591C4